MCLECYYRHSIKISLILECKLHEDEDAHPFSSILYVKFLEECLAKKKKQKIVVEWMNFPGRDDFQCQHWTTHYYFYFVAEKKGCTLEE